GRSAKHAQVPRRVQSRDQARRHQARADVRQQLRAKGAREIQKVDAIRSQGRERSSRKMSFLEKSMQVFRSLIVAACAFTAAALPFAVQAQGKPEKAKVSIAVGGKSGFYYLPLTIAERLGYFKDEGLEVEISDFEGGSKALQAVVGGSADVVSGAWENTIDQQPKGLQLQGFVLECRYPMNCLALAKFNAANYKSPKDLKGMKIGVSAPGSSTNRMVLHLL